MSAAGSATSARPANRQAPRFPREAEIRALARTNATVAACLALVDGNGLDPTEALAACVLELAETCAGLTDELVAARYARPPVTHLSDRTDDDECIACGNVDCAGCVGGAA